MSSFFTNFNSNNQFNLTKKIYFFIKEIAQYTFACGNQTVFNQFSLTCAHESEAVPCASSADFFYLNERLGRQNEFIHTDDDVTRYNQYIGRQ